MRKESFEAASAKIKEFFLSDTFKAYTTFDITQIFNSNRQEWKIAGYRNTNDFIKFLEDSKIVKLQRLKHQTFGTIKKILLKPNATTFDIGLTIKKDGYLSNYTAMQIHQLTLQIPKSIYTSFIKSEDRHPIDINSISLTQESIDAAFLKSQRVTSEVYRSEIDNYRYYFIQKGYVENKIGVIYKNGIAYTDLERTLIDISIRPAYSGGVFEVLEAFSIAKDIVDTNKLNQYLLDLNYIYPYHQVIGFYMEKANYENAQLKEFLNNLSNYKFYLTYNMSNREYNERWKIYYPKGF